MMQADFDRTMDGRIMKSSFKIILPSIVLSSLVLLSCKSVQPPQVSAASLLLDPAAPAMNSRAPDLFDVRLETSKGEIVIEVHRDWSPHGADRFYNLVRAGYYDDARFFRVIQGRWAQFGINGDPKISNAWRPRTILDDPRIESNARGTIAYAFAVPNGRATQVFINLKDNAATHDAAPFVPFGKIVKGTEVADALNAEYGESAGGGIRGGQQAALFETGNAGLEQNFPHLDYITHATVIKPFGVARLRGAGIRSRADRVNAELRTESRPRCMPSQTGANSALLFMTLRSLLSMKS
jgi:cyclophilin family peptidyl-prolyl cis-trans isomerase